MSGIKEFGFSVGVSPRESFGSFAEVAAEADRSGCSALWVIDSQLAMKDAYVAMTVAAGATDRTLIGPGVTNVFTRHPTVTANAMAGIDDLSGGRAVLGLGAGATAVHGANVRRGNVADVMDGIRQFRALMSGEMTNLDGTDVKMAACQRVLPIYVSASQPRMLQAAATIADGIIVMGAADPSFVSWQLEHVYRGLEESKRSRDDIVIDLIVTMSMDSDPELARSDVLGWVTSQARSFSRWKKLPPGYERYRSDYEKAAKAYAVWDHLSVHAKHNQTVSREFAEAVAIAGDHEYCLQRLSELWNLDVDRATFALLPRGRLARIVAMREDLLPHLRHVGSGDMSTEAAT